MADHLLNVPIEKMEEDSQLNSYNRRPIEEIPHPYQEIFLKYTSFNAVQSQVLDEVFYTDNSIVLSAPTGSGKTVVFELAILHLLIEYENSDFLKSLKIVYISPMKALCEERLVDWHGKFSKFGLNAISVTGDSDNVDFNSLLNHNLIITTPEKWDSLTRKWRDNKQLVQVVKLFMIDEVHLINEETRGATLEVIVCRMKSIRDSIIDEENSNISPAKIRFIAASATIPNIEDIAEWIGTSYNTKYFKFYDDVRPVKLNRIILGYPYNSAVSTPFKFDLALNYKLQSLIMEYSNGKPTLIFCSTRKIVEMTAKHLLQNLTINILENQKDRLITSTSTLRDQRLKDSLLNGVGYHHAGMLPETRRIIENLFKNSDLPILVTTSTLAMGVNLPAHLVIIKSTKCYMKGEFRDYTETTLLQMIGRAGRPQYDKTATVLILTTLKDKGKFERMIGGTQSIESNLHRNLIEHLNAEVALFTINDLDEALKWLSSTFLYVRAKKNPKYYGLLSGLNEKQIDKKLLDICQIEINKLIKYGMLTMDQDINIAPTLLGTLMAKYCVAFETIKLFTQITGYEILQQILCIISKSHEFSEMYLRVDDKKCLNLLNKCSNGQSIRFPLNGRIKTLEMKINCIIQAIFGCLDIEDQSIMTEALKILRYGERIATCLIEYLELREDCFRALLNAIIITKCFKAKLWENSPYVSKQLNGIGNVLSTHLVKAGKKNFESLLLSDPREIEMILNKKSPMGTKIIEQIQHLPKYSMKLSKTKENHFSLTIILENPVLMSDFSTLSLNSFMFLLVGDESNRILLYEKYTHSYLLENPQVTRDIEITGTTETIEAHFISEDWVGIDSLATYDSQGNSHNLRNTVNDTEYSQQYMDTYMKKVKKLPVSSQKRKSDENNNFNSSISSISSIDNSRKSKKKIIIQSNYMIKSPNSTPKKEQQQSTILNYFSPKISPIKMNTIPNTISNTIPNTNSNTILASPLSDNSRSSVNLKDFVFSPKKKFNYDTPKKNSGKISWRSPLIYSPPEKFSPKFNINKIINNTTSTTITNDNNSNTSLGSDNNLGVSRDGTINQQMTQTNKTTLPICDEDYEDYQNHNQSFISVDSQVNSNKINELNDFCSSILFEDFGLNKKKRNPPKLSKLMKENTNKFNDTIRDLSATEYYSQMIKDTKNDETTSRYFSQNTQSLDDILNNYNNDHNHHHDQNKDHSNKENINPNLFNLNTITKTLLKDNEKINEDCSRMWIQRKSTDYHHMDLHYHSQPVTSNVNPFYLNVQQQQQQQQQRQMPNDFCHMNHFYKSSVGGTQNRDHMIHCCVPLDRSFTKRYSNEAYDDNLSELSLKCESNLSISLSLDVCNDYNDYYLNYFNNSFTCPFQNDNFQQYNNNRFGNCSIYNKNIYSNYNYCYKHHYFDESNIMQLNGKQFLMNKFLNSLDYADAVQYYPY